MTAQAIPYNLVEAAQIGAALGKVLRAGDVILLSGDLGAGKTTLARGILQQRGLLSEAPSPSFAIVQPYAPPEVDLPIAHVDLYRIEDRSELMELGLDDYLYDGALMIEWPERLGAEGWPGALSLTITGEGDARILTADVPKNWEKRWPL